MAHPDQTLRIPSLRVVVVDTGYESFAEEERILGSMGARVEVFPGGRHDRGGKVEFARGAQGMFVRWTEVDEDLLGARQIRRWWYAM